MPHGIQIRGQNRYRAQVRRNGVYRSRTFDTLREAQQWHRVTDGKITGQEYVDNGRALNMTLGQTCDWMQRAKITTSSWL